MTPRTGSEGFTLVETLASLAVLALLSLLLLAGTQFARLRLARLDGAAQGEAIESAQGLLTGRIERSFPLTQIFSPTPTVLFDGTSDHLAFMAPPPDAAAPDSLQHYQLGLAADGTLRLSMVSDLAADPDQPGQAVALLRGVSSLDLAYFGVAAPDNQPRWRERWQQRQSLPQLVRVRVRFAPGDHRFWPDLIVRPAATLDSACVIDSNTHACRGRS